VSAYLHVEGVQECLTIPKELEYLEGLVKLAKEKKDV
jgi:hypothetical protein